MSEEKRMDYLRAKEVLDGAGWLFDDFVDAETRKFLVSGPHDSAGREEAYHRARVATELKLILLGTVENYEAEEKAKKKADERKAEREQKMKERRNGR